MTGLTGKAALITGAGGGVGRAAAQLLATRGACLAITDRDTASLATTETLVRSAGGSVIAHVADLNVPQDIERFATLAAQKLGGIDVICNVAGILGEGSIESATREDFDRIMHINCFAQLMLIQKALPALRRSNRASIVNVASVGALLALPLMTMYCASKAAVLGMTRAVAAELAPDIRCNAICPGGIDSPMSQALLAQFSPQEREALLPKLIGRQLMKRFASPEEIATLIAFLASDESSFLTGAVLPIDGGQTAW